MSNCNIYMGFNPHDISLFCDIELGLNPLTKLVKELLITYPSQCFETIEHFFVYPQYLQSNVR